MIPTGFLMLLNALTPIGGSPCFESRDTNTACDSSYIYQLRVQTSDLSEDKNNASKKDDLILLVFNQVKDQQDSLLHFESFSLSRNTISFEYSFYSGHRSKMAKLVLIERDEKREAKETVDLFLNNLEELDRLHRHHDLKGLQKLFGEDDILETVSVKLKPLNKPSYIPVSGVQLGDTYSYSIEFTITPSGKVQ